MIRKEYRQMGGFAIQSEDHGWTTRPLDGQYAGGGVFRGRRVGLGLGLRAAALSRSFNCASSKSPCLVKRLRPLRQICSSELVSTVRPESLFKVNLAEIEMRILKDPWIESVQLTKQFPDFGSGATVSRRSRGLSECGRSTTVPDRQGVAFATLTSETIDLPLVTGFESQEARKQAVDWIQAWDHMRPGGNLLDSLHWDLVRGSR